MILEEDEGGTVAAVEAELGLRRTRRTELLLVALLSFVTGEGASMRAENEDKASRVVVVDWRMRVPARRAATPGGGMRNACVCVSPMVVRAKSTAKPWRLCAVGLCILPLLVFVSVVLSALVLSTCTDSF